MIIKSPFRDYYDCVQGQGVDTGLVYLRIPREQATPRGTFFHVEDWYKGYRYCSHVIGFCGKIHHVLSITINEQSRVCLDMDSVDDFMMTVLSKQQWKHYNDRTSPHYFEYKKFGREAYNWPYRTQLSDVFKRLHEENRRLQSKQVEVFTQEHTPIFYTMPKTGQPYYRRSYYMVINGDLKPFHFQRLYDPYTAYQEIAMFLGSLAVPLKPIPKIDDKIMVGIKGFDKFSFRKEPTKRVR